MIGIVDYGMGNVRSVERAFASLGAEAEVTNDIELLEAADRLVLPGVGAFGVAMERLREHGLADLLTSRVIDEGVPFLGICLGMQLVCRESAEHGQHEGLGWIPASVNRLPLMDVRIPHVGWNDVTPMRPSDLLPDPGTFYFVHSYHVCPDEGAPDATLGVVEYGIRCVAALEHENIAATQFHPEKSQTHGLALLERFLAWQPAGAPV